MARLGGFEPPTARFVAEYSIQLSYKREIGGAHYRKAELCSQGMIATRFRKIRTQVQI